MADKCVKCNVECNVDGSDAVKCSECGDVLHVACAGPNVQRKTRKNNQFKCDKCKESSVSISIASDSEESSLLKAINSLRADFTNTLGKKLSEMEKKINESIHGKLNEINDKINSWQETVVTSITDLKSENELLREECGVLKSRCDDLSKQVGTLTEDLQELQQYSRIDNLEIVGVPLTKDEDVYAVLQAVANAIKTPWRRDDISIAHRVPSSRQRFRNIIVRFIRRTAKHAWISAAKDLPENLTAFMVHRSFPNSPVFINEHLSAHSKATLNHAKTLVKEKRLAYAWVKEGKILVRKTPNERPKRVRSVKDVEAAAGAAVQQEQTNDKDNSEESAETTDRCEDRRGQDV
ncbi:uncharacterized protein LOC128989056 [Macrosteles quadrilineatus]|uniref:uncharacterized protein LOC128989056 n=1 Tax=Macrosteles quadrilineatus TaxID=74068 RepID=UPI0023E176B2|nr:uncharacterized protein LOC128989056 [Macrosteles quadrilineatus]